MPGLEPGTFHMRSEHSTTELHPQEEGQGFIFIDDEKPFWINITLEIFLAPWWKKVISLMDEETWKTSELVLNQNIYIKHDTGDAGAWTRDVSLPLSYIPHGNDRVLYLLMTKNHFESTLPLKYFLAPRWKKVISLMNEDTWKTSDLGLKQNTFIKHDNGDAGAWTRDISHAKRTLYHWATSPMEMIRFYIYSSRKTFLSRHYLWNIFCSPVEKGYFIDEWRNLKNVRPRLKTKYFHKTW
jgi:hypothetical protein